MTWSTSTLRLRQGAFKTWLKITPSMAMEIADEIHVQGHSLVPSMLAALRENALPVVVHLLPYLNNPDVDRMFSELIANGHSKDMETFRVLAPRAWHPPVSAQLDQVITSLRWAFLPPLLAESSEQECEGALMRVLSYPEAVKQIWPRVSSDRIGPRALRKSLERGALPTTRFLLPCVPLDRDATANLRAATVLNAPDIMATLIPHANLDEIKHAWVGQSENEESRQWWERLEAVARGVQRHKELAAVIVSPVKNALRRRS